MAAEHIYTIPVNEAFESGEGGCPYCRMYNTLEAAETDMILGASMMEPEVRIATNRKGFCGLHLPMLAGMKNRLSLALMLESHLEELKNDLKPGVLTKDKTAKSTERIAKLEESCYICERIEEKLSKMFTTSVLLYDEEKEFRGKFDKTEYFCLPHYRRLCDCAKRQLDKKGAAAVSEAAHKKVADYLSELKEDISRFCLKFDYRNEDLPWGNSKDSVERAERFLNGKG